MKRKLTFYTAGVHFTSNVPDPDARHVLRRWQTLAENPRSAAGDVLRIDGDPTFHIDLSKVVAITEEPAA